MAKLTLVLSALAAAAAHLAQGSVLPTTARFVAKDFRGTFSGIFDSGECPRKIYHDGLVTGGNEMKHSAIVVDGATCNPEGSMQLSVITEDNAISNALSKFEGDSKTVAETAIKAAQEVPGSYLGVSAQDRVCGARTFPAGTIFLFSKSGFTFSTGIIGVPTIEANKRVMTFVEPGKTVLCPYAAKPRPSPSPTPAAFVPGETVPPTPEADLPVASPGAGPVAGSGSGSDGTPSVDPTPGPGSVCFPASAKVQLSDGSSKTMEKLQLGDIVRVADGGFSPVFMFTHKLSDVKHAMVQLKTSSGASLTLTHGHYVISSGVMRTAGTVQVGDELVLANGETSAVTSTTTVQGTGLYNPQTVSGTIVVDGVVASTYTTAVEPRTAHTMLAPIRAAFGWLGVTLRFLEGGFDAAASALPTGATVY